MKPIEHTRRLFLRRSASLMIAGAALPHAGPALASPGASAEARSLAFDHTHTGESLSLIYAVGTLYLPEALQALNHFLRDHYSGEVGRIDPQLFDLLYRLKESMDTRQPFQVISGYRCPATNAALRSTRGGGVASHSLHMEGKAIDIRLAGVSLDDLRDAASSLQLGGVGFYPHEQFVHVDTGRVRRW
jgi:uncharacterized protein YcbK (DUF882 family)